MKPLFDHAEVTKNDGLHGVHCSIKKRRAWKILILIKAAGSMGTLSEATAMT
jgi:hypothetical protein